MCYDKSMVSWRHGDRQAGEHVTFRVLRILEGLSIFFSFFMLMVLALYLIGSIQQFLDSSQFLLLEILEITAILCVFVTGYYLLVLIVWMVRRRFFVLPRVLYSIAAILLGSMLAYGSSFLSGVFGPVG